MPATMSVMPTGSNAEGSAQPGHTGERFLNADPTMNAPPMITSG